MVFKQCKVANINYIFLLWLLKTYLNFHIVTATKWYVIKSLLKKRFVLTTSNLNIDCNRYRTSYFRVFKQEMLQDNKKSSRPQELFTVAIHITLLTKTTIPCLTITTLNIA